MIMGKSRLFLRSISQFLLTALLVPMLTISSTLLAAPKDKLPEKYDKWLKEEVVYIISPAEKDVFQKLDNDRDRDRFLEEFWRQRDPTPGTLRNEFKEEHYRRIAYADDKFGRETPAKGRTTDRGRFYIKMGMPIHFETYRGGRIHPIEVWYYKGNPILLKTSFFRLLFYQPHGTGAYKLYNPALDGPRYLVTDIGIKPPPGVSIPSTLGGPELEDFLAQEIIKAYVSPMLVEEYSSNFPGDMLSGGIRSAILINDVNALPHKKIDDSYAYEFLEHKAVVEVDYSVHYMGNRSKVILLQDPSGIFSLNYALVPDLLSVDFFKDKYFAQLRTSVRVTDPEGKTVFQGERNIPIELRKEELKIVEKNSFQLLDSFPLVPGRYTFNLLMENLVSKEFTSIESKVTVPESGRLAMSPLLLSKKISRDLPPGGEIQAFQMGGTHLYPSVSNTFRRQDNAFLFFQVWGLTKELREKGILELILKKGEESIWDVRNTVAEFGGEGEIIHQIPLKNLSPGPYSIEVALRDNERRLLLFESTDLSITDKEPPGSWVISQSNPPAGDAYYSYIKGVQYLNRGERDRALPELAEACLKQPDSLNYALSYARALMLERNFKTVRDTLLPFAETGASHFGLFFSLGRASEELEDFQKAITFYQKALDIRGGIADILNRIGECWFRLGAEEEALRVWEKSLKINPAQENIKARIKALREKRL
jgi:GWxTD domain-containing protein